jgi:hypothetical protein
MRRTIALGSAIVAAVCAAVWLSAPPRAVAYASLRLARQQLVPGTLDVFLEPAPVDFRPIVSPSEAYRDRAAAHTSHDVSVSLAVVRQGLPEVGPVRRAGPAWIVVNHDVCYFTSKGDLISPARASGGERDGCTPRNLFIQVLDARTGDQLFTIGGFDTSGNWSPLRAAGRVGMAVA